MKIIVHNIQEIIFDIKVTYICHDDFITIQSNTKEIFRTSDVQE